MDGGKRPLTAADIAFLEDLPPRRVAARRGPSVEAQVRASLRDALAGMTDWQIDGMVVEGPYP